MSATGHRSSETGESTLYRKKRHEATHMTGAECPRSMTRGERRRDAAAACSLSPSSPGPSSTPQRQTWPALEPLTRAARGSDVTQMQVTSWRGGAGQAAIGTSSDSCGSEAAGGLGSRLKDGRADRAPCELGVMCVISVLHESRSRSDFPLRACRNPKAKRFYYYRTLHVVVDKNVSCITPSVSVQTTKPSKPAMIEAEGGTRTDGREGMRGTGGPRTSAVGKLTARGPQRARAWAVAIRNFKTYRLRRPPTTNRRADCRVISIKGEYGPLNPILFSPQKKASARLFPTSSHRQPVRVAEALRIGPGAKARVVHLWATCRWYLVRRASS
jgi:hypothetical protein